MKRIELHWYNLNYEGFFSYNESYRKKVRHNRNKKYFICTQSGMHLLMENMTENMRSQRKKPLEKFHTFW